MLQDILFALRALRKSWALSLLAVVSLALAVAGNTIVFAMVEAFLLRPFPFKDADSLHVVWVQQPSDTNPQVTTSPAEVREFRDRATSLDSLASWGISPLNLERGERPEQVLAARVTANIFDFLGGQTVLGRAFLPEDGVTGAEPTLVLAWEFWNEKLGADTDIIGRTLRVNGTERTVIGVLQPNWEILSPGIPFYVPMQLDRTDLSKIRSVMTFARLRPDVTLSQAREEIELIGAQMASDFPATNRGTVAGIDRLRDRIPDPRNNVLFAAVQGVLLCVLAIACVNIANLLLARGYRRQQEFALRSALGADRFRILRQLLTESLVLAVLGGGIGILLAAGGLRALNAQMAAVLPSYWVPRLDPVTLLFTVGLTAGAGLLFGLAPAWQSLKTNVVETLKEGGRGSALASRRSLLPRALVVAEICLALVLLSAASVMIRAFEHLQLSSDSYPADQLLVGIVNLPSEEYSDEIRINQLLDRLVPQLAALPGVTHATVASTLPRSPFSPVAPFATESMSVEREEELPSAMQVIVEPTYLETLSIQLLRGRNFTDRDREDSSDVILISRQLAERYFPGADPEGKRLQVAGEWRQIVGVVSDVRHEFLASESGPKPAIYLPRSQNAMRNFWVLLRSADDPAKLAEPMRLELEAADRRLSVGQVMTLEEFVNQFLVGAQAFMAILTAFGIIALALAALGIYGVLSYSVAQRSHEIGVRMALGAGRRHVLAIVLRQGGTLALIGFAIGLPLLPLVVRMIEQGLQNITPPVEWSVVVVVALVLLAVSLVASFLPARRAAAVDPLVALRME